MAIKPSPFIGRKSLAVSYKGLERVYPILARSEDRLDLPSLYVVADLLDDYGEHSDASRLRQKLDAYKNEKTDALKASYRASDVFAVIDRLMNQYSNVKSISGYLAKCMEGPNRGKPGPCPDPNAQAKKASKKTGGGSTTTSGGTGTGLIARGVARERARQEQYTGFLRDEFQDNRSQFHQLSQSFREGKISQEEYARAVQNYERSRHQYVSRLGISGLKKVAIALGVTAAAVGTAYVGYKYAPQIKGIFTSLNNLTKAAGPEKQAALYASTALGGITIAAEALKGNSTVDPTANTAKRVVEILLTKPPEQEDHEEALRYAAAIKAAQEDISRRGVNARPESIKLLYDGEKKVKDDIRSGRISKEALQNAVNQVDATLEADDFEKFLDEQEKQVLAKETSEHDVWAMTNYERNAGIGAVYARQLNKEKEAETGVPFHREVVRGVLNSKHSFPSKQRYQELSQKPKRDANETQELRKIEDNLEYMIAKNKVDPVVVTDGLIAANKNGYGAMPYADFLDDLTKYRIAKKKRIV